MGGAEYSAPPMLVPALSVPERSMKDSQLKALIKKTTAKASQPKKQARASFDPTLDATRGDTEPLNGTEAEEIFKEMKRREF
jgi:hypothetical protein